MNYVLLIAEHTHKSKVHRHSTVEQDKDDEEKSQFHFKYTFLDIMLCRLVVSQVDENLGIL